MYGLRRFGIKLGLSTIQGILAGLGDPQTRFRVIHIAGTNGKGSIASALSTILRLSGRRVGLYTSPHLVRFNERICIDNRPIGDDEVLSAHREVKRVHQGDREPTFFEFSTAMAFHAFAENGVSWAVVETGMGGRLDATNVVSPELAIITNISLEHRTYLGNTLERIAREKAGIIKPERPVVTGVRQPAAVAAVEERAREVSAPVFRLGRSFKVRRRPDGAFTYMGMDHTWRNLRSGLPGYHQVDNAALVLAACEVLGRSGVDLPEEAVRRGLMTNRWPGRLEVVSHDPYILLDGAHNLMAARNLASFLAKDLSGRKITLVAGILDDKPHAAMLKTLLPVCAKAVLTRADSDRSLPPETLARVAEGALRDVTVIPVVADALAHAIDTADPDTAVCVAGSLYVVGEAREALEKRGFFREVHAKP